MEIEDEITIEKIMQVIEIFNFGRLVNQSKVDFVKTMFGIPFEDIETMGPLEYIAERIQIKLILNYTCTHCFGWGCNSCRGTGKNIQAIYK